MPKLDVMLNGRPYPVVCGDGEELRVRQLAQLVEAALRGIAPGAPGATDGQLLVLTALSLADRLLETDAEAQRLRAKLDEAHARALMPEDEAVIVAAVNHLTGRVDALAERLATP